jgi:16S rRNA (cytosine967-C5)-methyltransferase
VPTISKPNLESIKEIFDQIFSGQKTSDKVFEEFFRKHHLSERDKAIIVPEVYSLLRNRQLPDWINEHCQKELGNAWPPIGKSLIDEPPLVLRVNTGKITRESLQYRLKEKGISCITNKKASHALILNQKTNVFKLPEFQCGFFEVQDISSQLVSHFMNPQPGWRIVDGCAGNGGKSLHLANLMQNKGKIISLDIYQYKLDTLKKRARRAGLSIIETRLVDSTKVIKRMHETADAVLLDVPCSGLGVLKRNPEIKWRLQPSDLENLQKTQEDILWRYSLMVKSGGKLVYSTCSILPSENSQQIQNFLDKTSGKFELIHEQFLSPELGFDGFFMAELKRKNK